MTCKLTCLLMLTTCFLAHPVFAQEKGKKAPSPPLSSSNTPTAEDSTSNKETPSRRFPFGPEAGFYVLADGKSADAFGRVFSNIGLGIGSLQRAQKKGQYYFDANLITNRRRGSDVVMFPLGGAYRRSIARKEDTYLNPYIGGSTHLIPMQLQSERYGLLSRFRVGLGGSVFVGCNVGANAYLQARYYQMNTVRGFNLSGTSLSMGYRF